MAVAATASPPGSWGQSAIDLPRDGYVIVQRTTVDGFFQGCDRQLEIHLANGTVFDCNERNHHMAYRPKAVLLKNVRVRTYALMIDGRAYTGQHLDLCRKTAARPWPIGPAPGDPALAAAPAEPVIPGRPAPGKVREDPGFRPRASPNIQGIRAGGYSPPGQ